MIRYFLPFTGYPYVGESIACDLCGETDTVPVCDYDRRLKRLHTVACKRCGLMRTDPMPTLDEVTAYYTRTYRRDYGIAMTRPTMRHLNRSHREAAARLDYLGGAVRSGTRVLDFGSGAGVFLSRAKEAGADVLGIEPGREFASFARGEFGVEVVNDIWEQIELQGPFDVITTVEVLEHLRQPVRALAWLAGLLAPEGIIYVTVPNMLPNERESFRRFHFAHLYGFTPSTLVAAGAVCGLEADPRYEPAGTRIVFRKLAAGPAAYVSDRDLGPEVQALYPRTSIAAHLASGRWLASAGQRLAKTVRDTISRSK